MSGNAKVDVNEFEHVISAAQIYIACTTSILVWDWLSCLPQEWRYIWKPRASWSLIKFLYCMVRYYTLLVLVVTGVWFFANWSESSCSRYVRILPGIAVLIDLSIEAVLAVRIYALYGCDRRIAIFLIVMLAGFLGVMVAVPIIAFDYTRLPSWPGPCIVTGKPSMAGPKFIIAFYASPMTCDIIMTAMTVYRAFKQTRQGGSSSLMNRMVRDGLFYFFAISTFNLLNVIFFIQSDGFIQAINAPASIQISSVLCCRLILNLRAENDASTTVKKYSNTRGRWITDIIHDNSVILDPIRFTSGVRTSRASLPAVPPSTPTATTRDESGIIVHLEQEVHTDTESWKIEEDEDPTASAESIV